MLSQQTPLCLTPRSQQGQVKDRCEELTRVKMNWTCLAPKLPWILVDPLRLAARHTRI